MGQRSPDGCLQALVPNVGLLALYVVTVLELHEHFDEVGPVQLSGRLWEVPGFSRERAFLSTEFSELAGDVGKSKVSFVITFPARACTRSYGLLLRGQLSSLKLSLVTVYFLNNDTTVQAKNEESPTGDGRIF